MAIFQWRRVPCLINSVLYLLEICTSAPLSRANEAPLLNILVSGELRLNMNPGYCHLSCPNKSILVLSYFGLVFSQYLSLLSSTYNTI